MAGRSAALEIAEKAFNRMDTKGDGKVNQRKVIQAASPVSLIPEKLKGGDLAAVKKHFDEIFKQYDDDGDHQISKAEWIQKIGDVFDSVIARLIASDSSGK